MLLLIILGFVMATTGIALLFLGEVPFLAGKRIPARRARLLGLVLVSFLPLTVGVRQLVILLFGSDAVEGHIITWSVFGFCWLLVAVILFRVLIPKGGRRTRAPLAAVTAKKDPFPVLEVELKPIPEPTPVSKQPTMKGRTAAKKPPAQSENPFDFS